MISEGFLVVVDRLVLQFDVVDEIAGGGFEDESVFLVQSAPNRSLMRARISDRILRGGLGLVQALPTRW